MSPTNDLVDLNHSFIIKLWLEETAEEAEQALWRGHITHVPSGKRSYLRTLDAIPTFIAPYVGSLGAPLPQRGRILRWVRRLLRRPDA